MHLKTSLFDEMSKEEIYALFDSYKFRDQHDYELLNCFEFTQIVDHVIGSRECPTKSNVKLATEGTEILDS